MTLRLIPILIEYLPKFFIYIFAYKQRKLSKKLNHENLVSALGIRHIAVKIYIRCKQKQIYIYSFKFTCRKDHKKCCVTVPEP